MDQFLVFLIFKLFVGRQCVITIEVRVPNLINDIFADEIDGGRELVFDLIEIAVNRFLELPTFWLDVAVHRILFDKADDFLLG